MKELFNVFMDPYYIRDAQMIDTSGLTDDELQNLDFSSEETENLCHDIEPYAYIGTFLAESEDEAVQIAGKEKRYDPRVLFAEHVKRPRLFRANVVLSSQPQKASEKPITRTITGVVMAYDVDQAKEKITNQLPGVMSVNTPSTIRIIPNMQISDIKFQELSAGWFYNVTKVSTFVID